MMRVAPLTSGLVRWPTQAVGMTRHIPQTVSAELGEIRTESRAESPADGPALVKRPPIGDYVVPLVTIVVVLVAGWWSWRWSRRRPTRGLKRAIRRAKQFNREADRHEIPHPVPEMEMERRAREGRMPDVFAPERETHRAGDRRRARRRIPDSAGEEDEGGEPTVILDPLDQEFLERLERLKAEPDEKNPITDYQRLDAFVRRYLYEQYGVKTFSVSARALLESLPQDLTAGVVDFAGEILRTCEMIALPSFRPSRGELRNLYELAAEMIRNHSRFESGSRHADEER